MAKTKTECFVNNQRDNENDRFVVCIDGTCFTIWPDTDIKRPYSNCYRKGFWTREEMDYMDGDRRSWLPVTLKIVKHQCPKMPTVAALRKLL